VTQTFAPCWRAEDANRILKTEALETRRAQFMATHRPIVGFDVDGSRKALVSDLSEHGILQAIQNPALRHAFVVVEGEPGSGKSHLIRWLYVNWDRPDDLVLMVQRAEGSLEGTLRQLKGHLKEFEDLFVGLGQVQDKTEAGRAADFQSQLGNSLNPENLEKPLSHSEWCKEREAYKVINNPEALKHWQAPRRILNVITAQDGERNSRVAEFTLADIVELARLQRYMTGIGRRAVMCYGDLADEADRIKPFLEEGKSDPEIIQACGSDIENSRILMEALNDRLNYAVRNLLGISSQGLKELFRRLRERLKEEDRRLILLLEDITSFQGIDDQLVDVLVTQSDTVEDEKQCDLLSVVGITPGYYSKHFATRGNVESRITFFVRLGHAESGSSFWASNSLQTSEERQSFAATYLRAVRAEETELDAWFEAGHGQTPVPNRCDECSVRESCHQAFGHVNLEDGGDVGLFPFTPSALDRLYETMRDPYMTQQTPRGLLQGVLLPSMLVPDAIDRQQFPGPEVETKWHPDETRKLFDSTLEMRLENRVADSTQRQQMRRLLVWWGNQGGEVDSALPDGTSTMAGIPKNVFDALGLPWLGRDAGAIPAPRPPGGVVIQPKPVEIPAPLPPDDEPWGGEENPNGPRGGSTTQGKPSSGPGKLAPQKLSPAKLEQLRTELKQWQEGQNELKDTAWSDRLMKLLDDLPWRRLGIDPWVRSKLFTKDLVMLEGRKQVRSYHFVIPRKPWVKQGLDAWLVMTNQPPTSADDVETNRRTIAQLHRQLGKLVRKHVDRFIPTSLDGTAWEPTGTLVQLIVVRGWLRGVLDPEASPVEQWIGVFEERKASSDPESRVDSWKEVLDKTNYYEGKFREELPAMLKLHLSDNNVGMFDASAAASAISLLVKQLRLSDVPPEPTQLDRLDLWLQGAKIASEVTDKIHKVPGLERKRLFSNLERLNEVTQDQTLPEYLRRIARLADNLEAAKAKNLPHNLVTELSNAVASLLNRFDGNEATEMMVIDDRLRDFADSEILEEIKSLSGVALLKWELGIPAGSLKSAREKVDEIERTLLIIRDNLEPDITSGGGGPRSVAEVDSLGQRLIAGAEVLLQAAGRTAHV
jgi:hypothetical protein